MILAAQPASALEQQNEDTLILLSEVLFDPAGVDGSKVGGEWVELYVGSAMNLAGWSITDNSGAPLATLPAVNAPAHSSVLIYLSNYVPYGHDQSFADRTAAFAAGLPPGDYLGNLSGGVRLLSPSGVITDCLYWGLGAAPPGATGGPWPAGQFFDISYAGGRPTAEGESLGRPANPLEGLTMTVADWDRAGGRNAAGATPGGRNGVYPTDAYGLIRHAQVGVNQILAGLSLTEAPGWIDVVDAHVNSIQVAYAGVSTTVTAKHTFELVLRGVPAEIVGTLTTSSVVNETPGSVGYTLSTKGVLTGATEDGALTFELDIDQVDARSGYHTNAVAINGATFVVLRCNGVEYPFSIVGNVVESRTGQDTYSLFDQRTGCDYGGAGDKASAALTLVTRIADGTYVTSFGMDRAYPMLPPPLSQAGNQVVTGSEQLLVDGGSITNDAAEITTGLIWRFDKIRNWNYTTASLQSGQMAAFSFASIDGSLGKPGQHMRYTYDAPMRIYGQDRRLAAEVVGTTYIAAGKFISEAYGKVTLDDTEILTAAFYVDPPAQGGGCQHCASCRRGIIHIHLGCEVCDPPAPPQPPPAPAPAPPPPPAKEPTGFLEASAICAGSGTGAGATIGGVAGGIIGAKAGGVGAWPGAKAGAAVGSAIGAGVGWVGCSVGWLFGAFD